MPISTSIYISAALRPHQGRLTVQWRWLMEKLTTCQSAENKCQLSAQPQMGPQYQTHTLKVQGASQKRREESNHHLDMTGFREHGLRAAVVTCTRSSQTTLQLEKGKDSCPPQPWLRSHGELIVSRGEEPSLRVWLLVGPLCSSRWLHT